MFFTYIVLSIWMYSLERQKPQVVEVSPVVNEEIVKHTPKKSESVITETDQINSWFEESDIVEINNPQWENEEYYDPELYEEISFEDNFDKEYRNDVWDSYFGDFMEFEDTPEAENSENSETVEYTEYNESTENAEVSESNESAENILE